MTGVVRSFNRHIVQPVLRNDRNNVNTALGREDKNVDIRTGENLQEKKAREEAAAAAEVARQEDERKRQAALVSRNAERARLTRQGPSTLGSASVTTERKTLLGA